MFIDCYFKEYSIWTHFITMQFVKTVLQYEHFRNAIVQSWITKGNYNGLTIVITDKSEILIGQFDDGDLHGWYLLLAEDHYSYGNINRNKLEGYGIIKNHKYTIFGNFKNNLLEGVAVIARHSENKFEIVEYQRGKQVILVDEKPLAGVSLSQIVTKHVGGTQLTPRQYLSSKVMKLQKFGIFQVQISPNLKYFGFTGYEKNLGLVFNGDFLQSFGEFKDLSLNGLGRFIEFNSNFIDGVFQNGDWIGQGVEQKKKELNEEKEVILFRRQHHLKQMDFNNCHFIIKQFLNIDDIDLRAPQKFSSVQQLLNIRSRRTTTLFREHSPLKQKLKNYEKQATQYLNNQQTFVRPYNKTADLGKQPMILKSPQNIVKQQIEIPDCQQEALADDDIYELVKKMQSEQEKKRTELDQIIRTRTKSIL